MVINHKQQTLPPGGHHFPIMGLVLRADTIDELKKKITELRIANGQPVGDPEGDIIKYYAEHYPAMVQNGEREKPALNEKYRRWRDWVRYMWFAPPKKLLTVKEAELRWEKCRDCPFNSAMDWATSPEAEEFDRRLFLLRQGKDVPDDVGFCTCHGADLGLLAFLDAPDKVSARKDPAVPPKDCFVLGGLNAGDVKS